MIRNVITVALMTISLRSFAAAETVFLPGQLEVLVEMPAGEVKGLVVIAPAKKYLMRERLFSGIAKKLSGAGFVAVRFNWSESTLQVPGEELARAAQDIKNVIAYAQEKFATGPDKTVLITKSFSTKAIGDLISSAHQHILLTPNCSADQPFALTYDKILQSTAKLNIMISNVDPYCDVGQIYEVFESLKTRPSLFTTSGDHNFALEGLFGFQDQVVNLITTVID